MAGSIAVELRHVYKYFGETAAVDDVSLQIANGEFFRYWDHLAAAKPPPCA